MSMTFTKLFSSITESSVWMQDDHTRLVWIAMLAMADKRGRVWSSVPGLANRARVPIEAVERALGIFLAPDQFSRTKEHEGRRIEAMDGGWRLLNYLKYREVRDEEDQRAKTCERVRRHRNQQAARSSAVTPCNASVTPGNASVTPGNDNAEAEAEAEAERGNAPARGASAEVPDLKQAEAMVMADGIPADFIALAHADWMDNGGCNAKGIAKLWPAYARTRWRYEAVEWNAGNHRGRAGSRPVNGRAKGSVPDHSKGFFEGTGL